MKSSQSIAALAAALSKAQGEMPRVPFDSTNPFLKNRYATLGAVIEASRPILAKWQLSMIQLPVEANGRIGIESVLTHSSGEWVSETITIPLSEEKGKSMAQVAGSVITYLRRYSWASMLGMYADEDTDGNGINVTDSSRTAPAPRPPSVSTQTVRTPPAAKEATKQATAATRTWMLGELSDYPPKLLKDYAEKKGILMENETIMDWPLHRVPTNRGALQEMMKEIEDFANGDPLEPAAPASDGDPELQPWYTAIVPIPHKGQKRDEYLKRPDLLGSLYKAMKAGDQEAQARLWGFVEHFQPTPWKNREGKEVPPSKTDYEFRKNLDAFKAWHNAQEQPQPVDDDQPPF